MFISNVLTVYFTFKTWYGVKNGKDMLEVWYDEEGHINFDDPTNPLDKKDEVHHNMDMG